MPIRLDEAPLRPELALPRAHDPGLDQPIRVVLGPQDDYFPGEAIAAFLAGPWTLSGRSDRMAYQLDGPPVAHAKGFNIVSDGIAPGSIQVPGTRLPIVLLADRQTTGGYPKIATVISADLPALGRVGPGTTLAFAAVSVETAQAARRKLEDEVAAWRRRLAAAKPDSSDEQKLYELNLVSGVIDPTELD